MFIYKIENFVMGLENNPAISHEYSTVGHAAGPSALHALILKVTHVFFEGNECVLGCCSAFKSCWGSMMVKIQ